MDGARGHRRGTRSDRAIPWHAAVGSMMGEIVADYRTHHVGEREVVDWTRQDGIYRNVPVVYMREVTLEDYRAAFPNSVLTLDRCHFWEVSVD
jgi:hypothetical protein